MQEKSKIDIHQIFWYFVLFSIIGLLVETIFCYITTGVIESRKGLIWGPFCPVYGVGATILIILLNRIDKKQYIKLFMYGFVIGAVIEYLLSYGLEAVYSNRFWDYKYTNMDINGRICVTYSIFWGVLSIILMNVVKPFIDKFIKKHYSSGKSYDITKSNKKWRNIIEICLFIFLVIDALVTMWAINTYQERLLKNHYSKKQENVIETSSIINEEKINMEIEENIKEVNTLNKIKEYIESNYFTNERMKRTFPNLRAKNQQGEEVWLRDLIN